MILALENQAPPMPWVHKKIEIRRPGAICWRLGKTEAWYLRGSKIATRMLEVNTALFAILTPKWKVEDVYTLCISNQHLVLWWFSPRYFFNVQWCTAFFQKKRVGFPAKSTRTTRQMLLREAANLRRSTGTGLRNQGKVWNEGTAGGEESYVQNPYDSPLYCLVNGDPHSGLYIIPI